MKNGKNMDNLIDEIKKSRAKKEVEDYLMKQLDSDQSKKLGEIMNDDNAINELLSTPQAQSLLKKLLGEDDG